MFRVEIWKTVNKKVFCKSPDLGTLTTCTMQLGTVHVQISKQQTVVLCIIVKKFCLCYRYSMSDLQFVR